MTPIRLNVLDIQQDCFFLFSNFAGQRTREQLRLDNTRSLSHYSTQFLFRWNWGQQGALAMNTHTGQTVHLAELYGAQPA